MTPPRSSLVVVTHDTRDEVLGLLATSTAAGAREVVVVDCGSTDGTAGAVRSRFPDATVLELANAGYARGANAGVRRSHAPVVVIANADVRLDRGCVTDLVAGITSDPGVGAAGPAVRDPSGAPQSTARRVPAPVTAMVHGLLGRWMPSNRWTARYRADDLDPRVPRDAEWLSGCVLAVRRSAFDSVGGFDPGYFMYVEDVDLGVRLRAAGWRLRYLPTAGAVHRGGASTSRRPVASLLHHARSLDRYHRRHNEGWRRTIGSVFVRAGLVAWVLSSITSRHLMSASRGGRGERARAPVVRR